MPQETSTKTNCPRCEQDISADQGLCLDCAFQTELAYGELAQAAGKALAFVETIERASWRQMTGVAPLDVTWANGMAIKNRVALTNALTNIKLAGLEVV
jgi:hypothetical protein